jgi:hypothetical protein
MIAHILAGCITAKAAMWTVTTALRIALIVVMVMQLTQE